MKDSKWLKIWSCLFVIGIPSHTASADPFDASEEGLPIDYGLVLPAGSAPERLILEPETGNYILTYKTTDIKDKEILVRLIYEPRTKISPLIYSKFRDEMEGFSYAYRVHNSKTSKQALNGLLMFVDRAEVIGQKMPVGWRGRIIPNSVDRDVSVGWRFIARQGLSPGHTQEGFVFRSPDLPGVGIMRLTGAVSKILAYTGEGPDPDSEVGKKFNQLDENNFVTRHVALPKIPLSKPFDAAIVLSALQKHVKEEITSMALVEPSFADQLDRSLIAAIEAAKRGNNDGLRAQLKDIRQMLKKEHSDLDDKSDAEHENRKKSPSRRIDKLAARVLDFDIKYVLKQTYPGDEDM